MPNPGHRDGAVLLWAANSDIDCLLGLASNMPARNSAAKNGQAIGNGDGESGSDVENEPGVIELEIDGGPKFWRIEFDGGPELEESYKESEIREKQAKEEERAVQDYLLGQISDPQEYKRYAAQLAKKRAKEINPRGEPLDPLDYSYDFETGRYDNDDELPEPDLANPPQWTMNRKFSWHPLRPFPGEAIKWHSNVYDDGTT